MQELAVEAVAALGAVLGVAGHRVADRGEVDADLVGAAGLEAGSDQGVRGKSSITSKWVRASREPAPWTAIRVRRRRCRGRRRVDGAALRSRACPRPGPCTP